MKKKALSLALALVVCLGLTIPAMAGGIAELAEADGTHYNLGEGSYSGNGWNWDIKTETLTLNGFHGQFIRFGYYGKKIVIVDGSYNTLSDGLVLSPRGGGDGYVIVEGTGELVIDRKANGNYHTLKALSIDEFYGPVTITEPLQLTGGIKTGDNDPLSLKYDEDKRSVHATYPAYKGPGYPVTASGSLATYVRISTSASVQPQQPAGTVAAPTNDKLTVNGQLGNATVYKIDDSNYFKIRDVAALLNGTEKQFAVGYDGEKNAVTATPGQGYDKLDTDLAGAPSGGSQDAALSNDAIYVNGEKITAEVYKIGGSNYFKLRDLGRALDFYVGWSAERGIYIETSRPYSE